MAYRVHTNTASGTGGGRGTAPGTPATGVYVVPDTITQYRGGRAGSTVLTEFTLEEAMMYAPSEVRLVTSPSELAAAGKELDLTYEQMSTYSGVPAQDIRGADPVVQAQERKDAIQKPPEAPPKGGLDDPEWLAGLLEDAGVDDDVITDILDAKKSAGKGKGAENGVGVDTPSPLTSGISLTTPPIGGTSGDMFPSGPFTGITSLMGAPSPLYGPGSRPAGYQQNSYLPTDATGRTIPWVEGIPDTPVEAIGFPTKDKEAEEEEDTEGPSDTLNVGTFYEDPAQFAWLTGGQTWVNPPPSDTTTKWQDPVTGVSYVGHNKGKDMFGFPAAYSGKEWSDWGDDFGISDWEKGTIDTPPVLQGVTPPDKMGTFNWLNQYGVIPDSGAPPDDFASASGTSAPWLYTDDSLQPFFASPFDPQYMFDNEAFGSQEEAHYPGAYDRISGDGSWDAGQVDPAYQWFDWGAEENLPYYEWMFPRADRPYTLDPEQPYPGAMVQNVPEAIGDDVFNWIKNEFVKNPAWSFNPPPWSPGHNPSLDILGRPAEDRLGLTWHDFTVNNQLDVNTGMPVAGRWEDGQWNNWEGFQDPITIEDLGLSVVPGVQPGRVEQPFPPREPSTPVDPSDRVPIGDRPLVPPPQEASSVDRLSNTVEGVAGKFFEEVGSVPAFTMAPEEYPSAKMGRQPQNASATGPFMGGQVNQTPLTSGLSGPSQNPMYPQQIKRRGLFAL